MIKVSVFSEEKAWSKRLKNKDIFFKLETNPDIIKFVSKNNKRPTLVIGFAAETKNLIQNATKKLEEKQLDMIIGNSIGKENAIFGEEYNKIFMIDNQCNVQESERLTKNEIANLIISKTLKLHEEIYAKNYNRKSITI